MALASRAWQAGEMPRAVWSGTISFGLVALPVRLFPATEPKDVRFHLYDRSGRRIRYRRVVEGDEPWGAERRSSGERVADDAVADTEATDTGEPAEEEVDEPVDEPVDMPTGGPTSAGGAVAWEEVARGVEDELGRVILLSSEEIDRARPERSRTIDIEDFVRLEDIDPVYFEKSYYLAPSTADAVRPYVLLHRALADAGRVGIGRFVLRTRPHLVAIRPTRGVLGLETLYFGDEVREPAAVVPGLDSVEVSERELELADRLVETLQTEWDPAAYADTYREELLRILSEKEPSRAATVRHPDVPIATGYAVEDLMRALRESVDAAKERGRSTPEEAPRRRTRRAAGERAAPRAGER